LTEEMVSDDDGKLYVTPAWFESDKGRPQRTVRAWIRNGQARSLTRDGTLYVHWGDALRLHQGTPTQARGSRRSLRDRAS
jgi:hypothetical protein